MSADTNNDGDRVGGLIMAIVMFAILSVALGMLAYAYHESIQHHSSATHPRFATAYNEAMMNTDGMKCASNHCSNVFYGEPVPVAGSHACATYQGKRNCVTWKALPCEEPKGVICPSGQVWPTPPTLRLANGQTVHELSFSVPAYYLVGTSGPLRTLHAIDAYANHGVEACVPGSIAWQQANQYTQLPTGTQVSFC